MKRRRIAGNSCPMLAAACFIAVFDQIIKLVVRQYPVGSVLLCADPFFEIVHTVNRGAAFSMLSGRTVFLLVITSLMLLFLAAALLFYRRLTASARWAMAALLGGGIGNAIDRALSSGVTDYIRLSFIRFPVFNFSDICITLSVLCLIVLLLTNRFETTGESHGTGY